MAIKTYYQILGLKKDSSQEEIKQAYRKLARIHHPDMKGGSDLKMKEINFIYSILTDINKRKYYDDTLGAKEYFDKYDWYAQSGSLCKDIYCNETEVVDSSGKNTVIKVGQDIYYLVELNKYVFAWKWKKKEYFNVYIKLIFDSDKKEYFSNALKYDFNKTPLCLVHYGEQDLIIYKEEFQSYWLSEESYNKIDLRKGIFTACFVGALLVAGIYYLFASHQITPELQKEIQDNKYSTVIKIDKEYMDFLKNEYSATPGEINYIATDKYIICTKETTRTKELVEVRNAPDIYALIKGTLAKNTEVVTLLYFKDQDAYKIKSDKIIGWVAAKVLENPYCGVKEK